MPDLINARRSFFQATYTPRMKSEGTNPQKRPGRAIEKVALLQALNISESEASRLGNQYAKTAALSSGASSPFPEHGGFLAAVCWAFRVARSRGALVVATEQDASIKPPIDATPRSEKGLADKRPPAKNAPAPPRREDEQTNDLLSAMFMLAADRKTRSTMVVMSAASILHDVHEEAIVRLAEQLVALRRNGQDKSPHEKAEVMSAEATETLIDAFKGRMEIEPLGYLHLERLSFIPAGIERGELVHALPLAPAEEVNVTHRQWSNTSEEFDRIVTDFEENFSERGVIEKTELVQSTSSQHQHAMGLNTGVTASGGFGPVNVTVTAGLTLNESASVSAQYARNSSIAATRKASSRSKKENKVSFRTASAAGTEDATVQRITNPYADRATRVDFYQLIRKWRVNLYRYGIRLTYDIIIPEPGLEMLGQLQEIERLRTILGQGFGDPEAPVEWARFSILPGDLDVSSVARYAALYGAAVPPPPPDDIAFEKTDLKNWTHEQANASEFHTLEFDVPEGYVVGDLAIQTPPTQGQPRTDGERHTFYVYAPDSAGRGGRVTVLWRSWRLSSAFVKVVGHFRLTAAARSTWQQQAWNTLRDAAQARYYERRQAFQDRLGRLVTSLGEDDALTLRKVEREEIMKGVMRWMFGPAFESVLDVMPSVEFDATRRVASPEERARVAAQGEVIKFLHHAIEWENIMYVLYPYFWSDPDRWEEKKYLTHPDTTRRAFLKAGSARVVLTVRPGFESAILHFMDTATFGDLSRDSPYFSIAQEVQAYASTHYPGIPSNDPDGADAREQGELIGTWFEYTPTTALDIAFGETLPTA